MSNIFKPVFKCTATGDAMITRRLPFEGEYEGFREVRDFILQGDFRFSNLETTVHNFESWGGAQSGGSWLCSPPGVIKDMRKFGFNILSTANNHALDYSYGGLIKTLEYLEKEEFPAQYATIAGALLLEQRNSGEQSLFDPIANLWKKFFK